MTLVASLCKHDKHWLWNQNVLSKCVKFSQNFSLWSGWMVNFCIRLEMASVSYDELNMRESLQLNLLSIFKKLYWQHGKLITVRPENIGGKVTEKFFFQTFFHRIIKSYKALHFVTFCEYVNFLPNIVDNKKVLSVIKNIWFLKISLFLLTFWNIDLVG